MGPASFALLTHYISLAVRSCGDRGSTSCGPWRANLEKLIGFGDHLLSFWCRLEVDEDGPGRCILDLPVQRV